jgi:RNA polymerase sigma-70 factor (ECF subfamily)
MRKIKKKKEMELSDIEIVNLLKEDIDMYAVLIERYEKQLMIYVRRILFVSVEDAEDILQEIFIKVYRNINSYDPKYNFSSWIYRIAHNEAVSYLRSKKRKQISKNISGGEDDIFEKIPSDIDIEGEYIKKDSQKVLTKALKKLDSKYREVLILRFFEEKEYNEISEILHIPSGTVASLINRGKERLKILIEEDGRNI